MSTSKTGKHGHAKCKFTAVNIFNGNKLEMLESSTHNVNVPNVNRSEWQLLDITDEDYLSLMDSDGNMREDIKLPLDDAVAKPIRENFDNGDDLLITILSAMGTEQVMDSKKASL